MYACKSLKLQGNLCIEFYAQKCERNSIRGRRIFIGFPDKFANPAFYAGLVSLDFTGDNRRGAPQRSNQCGDCYSTQKSVHNSGAIRRISDSWLTLPWALPEIWQRSFSWCPVAHTLDASPKMPSPALQPLQDCLQLHIRARAHRGKQRTYAAHLVGGWGMRFGTSDKSSCTCSFPLCARDYHVREICSASCSWSLRTKPM